MTTETATLFVYEVKVNTENIDAYYISSDSPQAAMEAVRRFGVTPISAKKLK